MWQMAVLFVITAFVAAVEIPSLHRRKLMREIWVFSPLLLLGSGLNFAYLLRIPLKNPLDWLFKWCQPVSDFILHYLQ